jgi:hypothetical protein
MHDLLTQSAGKQQKHLTFVLQKNMQKNKENISRLNDAVELLDRNLQEQRKQQERLLAAEIQSR